MSSVELRQRVKKQIDDLPAADLRSAAKFIASLRSPRPNAADLRKIAGMKKVLSQAEREFAAGRGVGAEGLKRKY